jgi:cell division septum initiation protein DivIVA
MNCHHCNGYYTHPATFAVVNVVKRVQRGPNVGESTVRVFSKKCCSEKCAQAALDAEVMKHCSCATAAAPEAGGVGAEALKVENKNLRAECATYEGTLASIREHCARVGEYSSFAKEAVANVVSALVLARERTTQLSIQSTERLAEPLKRENERLTADLARVATERDRVCYIRDEINQLCGEAGFSFYVGPLERVKAVLASYKATREALDKAEAEASRIFEKCGNAEFALGETAEERVDSLLEHYRLSQVPDERIRKALTDLHLPVGPDPVYDILQLYELQRRRVKQLETVINGQPAEIERLVKGAREARDTAQAEVERLSYSLDAAWAEVERLSYSLDAARKRLDMIKGVIEEAV